MPEGLTPLDELLNADDEVLQLQKAYDTATKAVQSAQDSLDRKTLNSTAWKGAGEKLKREQGRCSDATNLYRKKLVTFLQLFDNEKWKDNKYVRLRRDALKNLPPAEEASPASPTSPAGSAHSGSVKADAPLADAVSAAGIRTMHSFGSVGICFNCVTAHLQSLPDRNCSYKLHAQFSLCHVSSSPEAYLPGLGATGAIEDTAHHLQLVACIMNTALQLCFYLEYWDGKDQKTYNLGSYLVPTNHEEDLKKMTHLGCRITFVHSANVDTGLTSWWRQLSMGGQPVDGCSATLQFIGPETPYTSAKAGAAAKMTSIFHLRSISACRIVSEHDRPVITDLSNDLPDSSSDGRFEEDLRKNVILQSQRENEMFDEKMEDAFKGVTVTLRGKRVNHPRPHVDYPIGHLRSREEATVQYDAIDRVLGAYKHAPGCNGWQRPLYTLKTNVSLAEKKFV